MADDIDLAIFHVGNATPEIERKTLYFESYAVVARAGHRLAGEPLDLDAFAATDQIVTSFAGDRRGQVDVALERLGRSRNVVATLPLFHATMLAVARSDAIAVTNRSFALAHAARFGLAVFEPPSQLELRPYAVHAAWHRRATKSAVRRWVVDQIAAFMPENFADG
jgi:DNA-binding transcriptional LysR family regulator